MSSQPSIADRLRPSNRVQSKRVSLREVKGSVVAALNKQALRHSGIDPENPGEVDTHYLRDERLLVFDLGGEFSDGD